MMKNFLDTEFVIFDVETTGLSPQRGDRIVEIAALKVRDLKEVDRFCSFVDPRRTISPGAFRVNGITQEMLAGAPRAKDVLPDFLTFTGEACVVGHNVGFDLGFLSYELALEDQVFSPAMIIDTLRLSRKLLPELPSYALFSVAQSLALEMTQEHRAMSDVEMTFAVFKKLVEVADRKDIVEVEQLC